MADLCLVALQVALTGAEFEADVDGKPVAPYTSVAVEAGAVLTVSKVRGPGPGPGPESQNSASPSPDPNPNPLH